MKIGIDKIGFATSGLYVDMAQLARARNNEPGKYLLGLGQSKMAVIPPTQDVVTLACNAAEKILTLEDKAEIGLVIFGTESGIDNSKSAAIYAAHLLGLPENIRSFEIKQACYGATAGIAMARGYLALNPNKKVLVFGADIARYGLKTAGESTQGGGAVALLLGCDPAILALEEKTSYLAQDIMDFWRPIEQKEAIVQGKYSSEAYLDFFESVYADYTEQTGLTTEDFSALLFHLPYTKMGMKALKIALENTTSQVSERLEEQFELSRMYNRNVGNLYTGSLYLSLLSLLQNSQTLEAGQRLGLFSYGSGAQGEFFSGILQKDFKKFANIDAVAPLLEQRKEVTVTEYEGIYRAGLAVQNGTVLDLSNDHAHYVFAGVQEFQRQYIQR